MAAAAELKDADGSRRQSRRAAVMLLYQEDITGHPMADIVAQHERDAARPLPVYEVEKFEDPVHRRRLSMKPGLTCLWQIQGRSKIVDFQESSILEGHLYLFELI